MNAMYNLDNFLIERSKQDIQKGYEQGKNDAIKEMKEELDKIKEENARLKLMLDNS